MGAVVDVCVDRGVDGVGAGCGVCVAEVAVLRGEVWGRWRRGMAR